MIKMKDIINILRNHKLRPTKQRINLGSILFGKGDRHITAEILKKESDKENLMVSQATVYNVLNDFYNAGLLTKVNIDNDKTWKSIVANRGSVKHLKELSDWDKDVFATAIEIDQRWIIEFAADRQKHICQSQSVNLFFPPDVNKGDLHNVHMLAWAKNLKTLYYLRSEAISRADNVSNQVKREIIFEQSDCLSCEG